MTTSLGIDVSKLSVCCHVLHGYPSGGLDHYWRKSQKNLAKNYPQFYSLPVNKQKGFQDFLDYLDELKAGDPNIVAIIEPTGYHASKLWGELLKSKDTTILWVGHVQLGRYRRGKGLPNKSDPADALAMAAYFWDPDNRLDDGEANPRKYLIHQPDNIGRIREVERQLEHLQKVQSPIVNYSRQMLAWQFPEIAQTRSKSSSEDLDPPLWHWLSDHHDRPANWQKHYEEKYQNSMAKELGLNIDPYLRLHAHWMCDIANEEHRLEAELIELLKAEEFTPYIRIFKKYMGRGYIRIKARILTRCYPFEMFLSSEGKQIIEHELREVKKDEKRRERDEKGRWHTVVNRQAGEIRRCKRNRSRDSFSNRLGMATVLEQSGDKIIEKATGSAIVKKAIWQFIDTAIDPTKLRNGKPRKPPTEDSRILTDARDGFLQQKNLSGKHRQSKLASKFTNLLYKEFVSVFCR